jgi:hypothetical protein
VAFYSTFENVDGHGGAGQPSLAGETFDLVLYQDEDKVLVVIVRVCAPLIYMAYGG